MILTESTMKYILTFILSFLSFLVCSQNITITDIPTIDQLPVNAIHRVFRDSEGYMWYGTVNGLCRDDGYHVKVFRSNIGRGKCGGRVFGFSGGGYGWNFYFERKG